MTYKELYDKALWDLEHDNMTLGEFERITEPLNKEIPKEEQTDGDLISRVKDIIRNDTYLSEAQVIDLLRRIDELPSAEVKPIVYGEWIYTHDTFGKRTCNRCEYTQVVVDGFADNFCPNCGATMKKESEEEE